MDIHARQKNATYCDKHVSSRKCIFFVVLIITAAIAVEVENLKAEMKKVKQEAAEEGNGRVSGR